MSTQVVDQRSSARPESRGVASRVLSGTFVVLAVGALVQFALAGAGAFGGGSWPMHEMVGMTLELVAVVALIAAFLAREGRGAVIVAFVAFVLVSLQPIFAVLATRTDPAFGTLHGVVAALLFAHVAGIALGRIRRPAASGMAAV